MNPGRDAFVAALAAPEDGALASRFTAPLVTALLAEAREACAADGALSEALAATVTALAAVGVPRGRQFVLLGCAEPPAPEVSIAVRALRERLGVPVILHEPDGASFEAGRLADGTPVSLDDELREAEAIVAVGSLRRTPWGIEGAPALLCPGVASPTLRARDQRARDHSFAARLALWREVDALAPLDLVLAWEEHGGVRAQSGRALLEQLASSAGEA
jgi:hypothetical protein